MYCVRYRPWCAGVSLTYDQNYQTGNEWLRLNLLMSLLMSPQPEDAAHNFWNQTVKHAI